MDEICKITAKLAEDCNAECCDILKSAEEEAARIASESQKQSEEKTAEIISAAEKRAAEIVKSAESSARMSVRRKELARKTEIINSVIGDALSSLESMSGDEYLRAVGKLAAENAESGEGVMLLSADSFRAMPDGFENELNESLGDGKKLKIRASDELKKNGAILVYGDIEINLTFASLADAYSDELKEIARKILFE